MRRIELSRKPSLIACCGVLIGISLWAVISFGTLAADCSTDAIAHDVTAIETPRGRLEIEVCVTRDSASGTDTYRYWVKNIDIPCPITGFSVPRAGYSASELESRWHWEGNEEPARWLWFGGHKRGIQRGTRAEFALHIPGETSPETSDCSVWTAVASPCLGEEFMFQILTPGGAAGATTSSSDPDSLHASVVAQDWMIVPNDLAFDADGNLLVAANLDNRIAVLRPDGEILYYYELQETGSSFQETCVATTSSGNSYALNSTGLYALNADRTVTRLVSSLPMSRYPTHMCAGEGDTLYYVANVGTGGGLFEITLSPSVEIRLITKVGRAALRGLDRGPDGNLYAFASTAGEIIRFSPDGTTELFKSGFSDDGQPIPLAFSPDGTIFLPDDNAGILYEIGLDGEMTIREERPCGGGNAVPTG